MRRRHRSEPGSKRSLRLGSGELQLQRVSRTGPRAFSESLERSGSEKWGKGEGDGQGPLTGQVGDGTCCCRGSCAVEIQPRHQRKARGVNGAFLSHPSLPLEPHRCLADVSTSLWPLFSDTSREALPFA